MLDPADLGPLLHPAPMPLETGWERIAGGALHVAVRTDMHGCRGEMLEWWFRWRCDTQKYVWWHPIDHVSSRWQGILAEDTHVGSEHVIRERFSGLPAQDLIVQFTEPTEFFDADQLAKARESGAVSGVVAGRTGDARPDPQRTEDGRVLGGRLMHVARDTPWGMALRSHFFVGIDLPGLGLSRAEVEREVPDELAPALLRHAYDEFTFLSRFLPSLYVAEHRDVASPPAPW
ncbi:hypothetical protein FPZ12_016435 [Amycolatopsis acidicola]|uniref:DAPG hydrolase PhiG domain-containing protein n=1 Tax=Amycolatopsis acidicola TaxID=2596893 RepID=A0A5N0V886_9PSEU|nr:hypothetical protein [Amycolatopsis acidicola]KAA9160732.1 hypothetical protein FPZ12_016435 [Amycolatopsis acidicola]